MLYIVAKLLEVLEILIFVRVVMSWIDPARRTQFHRFVASLTDPFLAPFQSFARVGPVDFSPMIALIIIQVIIQFL